MEKFKKALDNLVYGAKLSVENTEGGALLSFYIKEEHVARTTARLRKLPADAGASDVLEAFQPNLPPEDALISEWLRGSSSLEEYAARYKNLNYPVCRAVTFGGNPIDVHRRDMESDAEIQVISWDENRVLLDVGCELVFAKREDLAWAYYPGGGEWERKRPSAWNIVEEELPFWLDDMGYTEEDAAQLAEGVWRIVKEDNVYFYARMENPPLIENLL